MYSILNIWPTTAEGWVLLGVAVLGLVGAVIKLIPTMIKLAKVVAELTKQKNFNKLKQIALKAMTEAQATGLAGRDKLIMVISAIKAGAKEAGIEINDADIEELAKSIAELKAFYNDMAEADEIAKNKKEA